MLQSDTSSPEAKRKTIEDFRAKREAWQTEMRGDVIEPTIEERAALRQRIMEAVQRMPKERREIMEARLAFSEEMEKFRAEEKSLNSEERTARRQQLMNRRRETSERQRTMIEAETARSNSESRSRPQSPFLQAVSVEKEKLNAALANEDPEQRREAMTKFRTAMNELREARTREMEQRTGR